MALASFFLFTIILLNPTHLQVNSQELSSEQTFLQSLKQHWNNPPFLESWNSTSSPCDFWPQIECTQGSVTGLHFAQKNITGTIPSSICHLKNLVSIDLSDNKISGRIPVGLYNCSSLENLDLSSNELSGTIPGEFFRMEKLRQLSLSRNRLSGIISIPIEAMANSLEYLDLSDNHLNGSIPDGIKNLYNLIHLDLSTNSLSGTIPTGLFSLHQLYSLSLGYNNLSGQLPTHSGFSGLQVLDLTHNNLNGTLPKSLGKLTELSFLDLSTNQFSDDIIDIFLRFRSISVLRLCSNEFSGQIPNELVNEGSDDKCLDLSNLCSDNGDEGLPICPSSLCSDNRLCGYSKSKPERDTSGILMIVFGIGSGVLGFAIFYYLARKCWLQKNKIINFLAQKCKKNRHSSVSTEKKEKWKMVAFQRLKFNKTEILTGLTDENVIGNGGSGKVYRVHINQTGRDVAVKSISNSRKSDHRLEKEFAAEILTLGSIRHYNIVKLFCYIAGDNMKLLVYQYFENKSLDQWLHGNNSSVMKLDWPTRLNIAIGSAQGLCYMHHDCTPPVIHRDIKSSNILLDSEFNAKIADFGLAKLLNGRGDTETASAVAGTFGYIAPEYAYTSKVNTKSDVYSFGVVLLELSTGRKAVTHGDFKNLAEWAQLKYRDASAIFDALDDEINEPIYLDQMVDVFRLGVICTAKSPADRPSMKDCLGILQNFRNNFSSSSPMNLLPSEDNV